MKIRKINEGNNLTLALEGRLDTTTAPDFDAVVKSELTDITFLKLDFKDLEYISSAGLRVLLSAQKIMNNQSGCLEIHNANENILEVFEITGFSDLLTIK